jgi:hypothetical protein
MLNTYTTNSLEKQNIWRQKQIQTMYGSGRPIFNITHDTQFIRENYDGFYYMYANKWNTLDNKNYIASKIRRSNYQM